MRMGLLDDAIREHLELKRRRGADPDEVAREQREVLDAAAGRRAGSDGVDGPAADVSATVAPEPPHSDGDDASSMDDPSVEAPAVQPAQPAAGAETAELDMSSVLGKDREEGDSSAPPIGTATGESSPGTRPVPARPATEEDSLEWEVPGEAGEEEAEEPAEDVLEETPDFLRDTPEQDRLWFEQRPPRDFDFDK